MAGALEEGAATGNPYIAAAGLVIDMFSGQSSTVSNSGASTQLNFDTSGVVVGKGDATGGGIKSSITRAANLPWYAWAAGALVGIAIMKKAA